MGDRMGADARRRMFSKIYEDACAALKHDEELLWEVDDLIHARQQRRSAGEEKELNRSIRLL
eukprot:10227179-Lingulodinium_polyedra.AAC.1